MGGAIVGAAAGFVITGVFLAGIRPGGYLYIMGGGYWMVTIQSVAITGTAYSYRAGTMIVVGAVMGGIMAQRRQDNLEKEE